MTERTIANPRGIMVLALVAAVSIPVAYIASRAPLVALAAIVGVALYVVFLRWPMFGILAIVFLLPFERIGAIDFAGVTVRPSQVVAVALIAAWLTRIAWRGRLSWRPQPLLIPLCAYLVVLGVGLTHAENPTRGLFVFAFTAFTLGVSILIPQIIRSEVQANRVVNVLLTTTAIVSAFGLFQFLGDYAGLPTSVTGLRDLYTKDVLGFPRVQSTALEPLYFANFLLLPLSLLTASLFSRVQRKGFFGLPLLLLAGLVLVLTVARGGYMAFAASIVVIIIFSLRQFLHPGRILAFGASVLIVGAVAMQLLGGGTDAFSVQKFTGHITNLFTGASYEERIATFDLARQAFREQPLVGIGPGQFGPYASINPSYEPEDGWKIVNNLTLEILAEAGMLGLLALALAFTILIVRSIRAIRRAPSPNLRALLVGGLAAVVGILVQYQTFSILYIMHVWVAVGLLVAFQNLAFAPPRE
jgi:O-antigen ligase